MSDAHVDLVVLSESLIGMGSVATDGGMDIGALTPHEAVTLLGAFLTYAGREAKEIADVMESEL